MHPTLAEHSARIIFHPLCLYHGTENSTVGYRDYELISSRANLWSRHTAGISYVFKKFFLEPEIKS